MRLGNFLKTQQLFLSQKGTHAECQRIKYALVIVEQQCRTGKKYTCYIKILNHSKSKFQMCYLQEHL